MLSGQWGSPPHTRDKFDESARRLCNAGITPAYAGQICFTPLRVSRSRDHPRIRGTNICTKSKRKITTGSPPHTRDKSLLCGSQSHKGGITPAYAGQIEYDRVAKSIFEDHPRIRGTNGFFLMKNHTIRGSPPHTRDKCDFDYKNAKGYRITPAYAGQMRVQLTYSPVGKDHPRIRGTNS